MLENQSKQYPANVLDTIDRCFVTHKWLGPTLFALAAVGCAFVSFFINERLLGRWEALSLMLAALMMLWCAWGGRATAMASRDELRELQRQRHAQMIPVVSMAWVPMATGYTGTALMAVTNVGLGPTMHLRVRFTDAGDVSTLPTDVSVTCPTLPPGADYRAEYVRDVRPFHAECVAAVATYDDVYGNLYESRLTTSEASGAWLEWSQSQ